MPKRGTKRPSKDISEDSSDSEDQIRIENDEVFVNLLYDRDLHLVTNNNAKGAIWLDCAKLYSSIILQKKDPIDDDYIANVLKAMRERLKYLK